MPKGIYPRNQAKKVNSEVKKLVRKRGANGSKRLLMTVISEDAGIRIDRYKVRSYFEALRIVVEQYDAQGSVIHEVRIGHV